MPSRLILSGLRSIEECLKYNPDRIAKMFFPPGKQHPRIEELRKTSKALGIHIENNPKADDDEPVLALLHDFEYTEFDALKDELKEIVAENPVVIALDGITDPQNLGAILRTAAFMGAFGVLLPKDRSAEVNNTVYRIASGGLEHIRISQVTNLVSAIQALKDIGFWAVGFSESAVHSTEKLKRDFPIVLVIGNEEKGIRPLVLKNCDHLLRIEGGGKLKSLNASVAAALSMAWAFKTI